MDVSYGIIHGPFELEAASMVAEETTKAINELERLTREGFGKTQMALDLATEAKVKMTKCCALLLKSGVPVALPSFNKGMEIIREMDKVILNIKHAMEES